MYAVVFTMPAAKAMKKLPAEIASRLADAVSGLAGNPRPPGLTRLVKSKNYRVRVGDYRIIYDISDDIRQVLILKIGNRRDVYKER
ncbi:MAG: mRNA interferase RelE/StbE [Desulfovibrionales bacterium]|nr:mRNA interferase RelE/StbE [Desulfovibrionales bacterium]